MPPPIPDLCGRTTCDHERPNEPCTIARDYGALSNHASYKCQSVKGDCPIHDKPERCGKHHHNGTEHAPSLGCDNTCTLAINHIGLHETRLLMIDPILGDEYGSATKALPTDDVLALVTEQRDRAVELLRWWSMSFGYAPTTKALEQAKLDKRTIEFLESLR